MKTDIQIHEDVIDQLESDPLLNTSAIGVAVKGGIVTLSGQVDSWFKKTAAENAVKKVAGVKAIAEDIQLSISPNEIKTDTQIAEAILEALNWQPSIEQGKIKIKVENGEVRLEGQVDVEYEATNVKRVIENLAGVRSVINLISVSPKPSVFDIKQRIVAAFQSSATIDAGKIEVDVVADKVILWGNVRSFAQMEEAKNAASAAPGVKFVDNKLELNKPGL
jgi:osmotically-inducible protein OsmY